MLFIIDKLNGSKEAEIIHACKTGNEKITGLYTFVNPYSYSLLKKDPSLCKAFNLMFSDGFLLKMIYNLFTRQKINRVSFDMSSLAPVIFSYAVRTGSTVAFIGSKQDNLEKFTAIVKNTFPGLNIVYLRHGYFENAESYEKAVVEVAQVNPDIVIAGLGTPLQEKFLVNLAQQGWNKLGFTCGGFMSQTQEKLNYYPAWIDKLNLRWVYRIVNESHTRKRFFKTYLIFPLIFTRDMIKGKFLRNAA